MVDNVYITDDCNSTKGSFGAIMKNFDMLKFVPDRLKTKKMCKHVVKKLPFIIRCIPDQYRTQRMCHKAAEESGRIYS